LYTWVTKTYIHFLCELQPMHKTKKITAHRLKQKSQSTSILANELGPALRNEGKDENRCQVEI